MADADEDPHRQLLLDILGQLRKGIEIRDRTWKKKVCVNCFIAGDAIQWMMKSGTAEGGTREAAVRLLAEMLAAGVIEAGHGDQKSAAAKIKDEYLYRCFQDREDQEGAGAAGKQWIFPNHVKFNSMAFSAEIAEALEVAVANEDAAATHMAVDTIRRKVASALEKEDDWKLFSGAGTASVVYKPVKPPEGTFHLVKTVGYVGVSPKNVMHNFIDPRRRGDWMPLFKEGEIVEPLFVKTGRSRKTPSKATNLASNTNAAYSPSVRPAGAAGGAVAGGGGDGGGEAKGSTFDDAAASVDPSGTVDEMLDFVRKLMDAAAPAGGGGKGPVAAIAGAPVAPPSPSGLSYMKVKSQCSRKFGDELFQQHKHMVQAMLHENAEKQKRPSSIKIPAGGLDPDGAVEAAPGTPAGGGAGGVLGTAAESGVGGHGALPLNGVDDELDEATARKLKAVAESGLGVRPRVVHWDLNKTKKFSSNRTLCVLQDFFVVGEDIPLEDMGEVDPETGRAIQTGNPRVPGTTIVYEISILHREAALAPKTVRSEVLLMAWAAAPATGQLRAAGMTADDVETGQMSKVRLCGQWMVVVVAG